MILTTLKLGCARGCSQAGSTGERNRERERHGLSQPLQETEQNEKRGERKRKAKVHPKQQQHLYNHTYKSRMPHSHSASASWKRQVIPDWFKLQTRGGRLKSNTSSQRDMAWYPEDACDRIASMRHPSISSVQGCTSWTRKRESFIQYSVR